MQEAAARGSWLVTIASAVVLYLLTRMAMWTLINLVAPPAWLVFCLLLWQPTWWSAALCSFALCAPPCLCAAPYLDPTDENHRREQAPASPGDEHGDVAVGQYCGADRMAHLLPGA